jgi:GTPase SAR1 family protein
MEGITKIAVVGDAAIGKTSLIYRYVYDTFLEYDSCVRYKIFIAKTNDLRTYI